MAKVLASNSQEAKMAAESGEPSDLGSQFESLRGRVEDSIANNIAFFKPLLQQIKAKLDELSPLIKETAKSNNELDETSKEVKELGTVMKQGIVLVEKCSSMPRFNPYKKFKYTSRLIELKEALQNITSDIKDILVIRRAKDVNSTMDTMRNNINSIFKAKRTSNLPMQPQYVVGMEKHLSELRAKLIDDDKVSKLVLTGPGGCGKTTLAVLFCNDQIVKDKFEGNILFVTVPKTPNAFEDIVEQLYQRKGYPEPAIHNKDTAVNLLRQFMTEEGKINPLLLVLDDVWPAAECVLQTFVGVDMPNVKILITSRCSFGTYASSYYLESLDDESAMALFRHSASLQEDQSFHNVESLSRKVVKKCHGIPLAITCVGRSLRGRPVQRWKARVIQLSRGSILDSETELLLRLKLSIDALEPGLKECFMDLASFPKHHLISVDALIDMWMELYAESKDDEDLYIGNISELINISLLTSPKKVEGDEFYGDKFVAQHDLLRDLAIYLDGQQDLRERERLIVDVPGNTFPKWWKDPKFPTLEARLASISTDKKFSMEWPEQVVQLPEVEVLVLNFEGNENDNYALPEIVATMHELKVLIVTNLGPSPVELSNFQLVKSLEDLKRIRLEKISTTSITKDDPIDLESVEKISLYKCDIGQAFPNCPNLEELHIDCCKDMVELPAEICELTCLEKLCVTNCENLSALPEEIGKLVDLEVLRVRSCTGLKKLPSSLKGLASLSLLDISGCSGIEELPDGFDEMSSLTMIDMRQCSSLKELPPSIDIEKLEEVICDEGTERLWKKFLPNPKIRVLQSEVS